MSVAEASLIITVLNEAASITGFLNSIGNQTRRPSEIVVVDGGSSDGTADIVRTWQPPDGVSVTLIESPGAGISRGRNLAISAAKFERLLVTDAGTEVDGDWGNALLAVAESQAADVVSGFFYPDGDTILQRSIAFTITPALHEIDPERFLPSSRSVSFTRRAWAAAGGYPEWLDYCEDLVFDISMKDAGFSFAFEPKAVVSWAGRPTIPAFMKQYYRYARGDGKANLWRKRHAVRYGGYITGLALLMLGFDRPWAWFALAVCAVLYLAKFWGRIIRRWSSFGRGALRALLLVPIIVIAGDVAKMIGYPAGVQWRTRHIR